MRIELPDGGWLLTPREALATRRTAFRRARHHWMERQWLAYEWDFTPYLTPLAKAGWVIDPTSMKFRAGSFGCGYDAKYQHVPGWEQHTGLKPLQREVLRELAALHIICNVRHDGYEFDVYIDGYEFNVYVDNKTKGTGRVALMSVVGAHARELSSTLMDDINEEWQQHTTLEKFLAACEAEGLWVSAEGCLVTPSDVLG